MLAQSESYRCDIRPFNKRDARDARLLGSQTGDARARYHDAKQ
jgi:hypothetical protein